MESGSGGTGLTEAMPAGTAGLVRHSCEHVAPIILGISLVSFGSSWVQSEARPNKSECESVGQPFARRCFEGAQWPSGKEQPHEV